MLKLLKNKKGVTLVELLAVIIILGIITAIAVPTIGNLIENQREAAAVAQWDAIIDAAELYQAAEPTAETVTLATLISEDYITLDASWEFSEEADGTTAIATTAITFDLTAAVAVDFPVDYTTIFLNGFQVAPAV
jgi:type IV pilus assembly protein PilA